jgi:hypothetical protein
MRASIAGLGVLSLRILCLLQLCPCLRNCAPALRWHSRRSYRPSAIPYVLQKVAHMSFSLRFSDGPVYASPASDTSYSQPLSNPIHHIFKRENFESAWPKAICDTSTSIGTSIPLTTLSPSECTSIWSRLSGLPLNSLKRPSLIPS